MVKGLAPAGSKIPDGMGPFLAGVLLLAVPVIALVAGTAAPTERGHWVVLLFALALVVYGVRRGIGEVS
jgi:hypothetical protein